MQLTVDSSRYNAQHPESGYGDTIFDGTVTVKDGASVYDALKASGLKITGSSTYVRSIGGLAEFAGGSGSGWLYYVNGSSPGYGCGKYLLSSGTDYRIEWVYTMNMGTDV